MYSFLFAPIHNGPKSHGVTGYVAQSIITWLTRCIHFSILNTKVKGEPMSFHRIFLIGACVLCTTTAFANNEAISCGDKWPCNYKKTYYVHDTKPYNTDKPEIKITTKGPSVLHFHPDEIEGNNAAELTCGWGDSWARSVNNEVYVYVTGYSRTYEYPEGYHHVSREEGKNKGWGSNGWNGWVVAKNGDKWYDHVFPYWETEEGYDKIWQCRAGNWRPEGNISDLAHCSDSYQVLKTQNNRGNNWAAVQMLYLPGYKPAPGHDKRVFDTIIAINGEKPCLTYRCRSGYQSDCDLDNESCPDARCKQENRSCEIKNSGDKKYMVTGESVTDTCLGSNYIPANSDVGVKYINDLKRKMNESLNANEGVAKQLYKKRLEDIPFTFDSGSGDYKLKEDIFQNSQCDFYCDTNGYKVRLKPQSDENGNWTLPCPKYFKGQVTGDDYTCVFDVEAANGKIAQMRTDVETAAQTERNTAIKKCAITLCNKSGGQYSPINGDCICGGGPCSPVNNTGGMFMHGGHGYYYCTSYHGDGCQKDHDGNSRWNVNKRAPTTDDIESWKSTFDDCTGKADKAYKDKMAEFNASSVAAADSTAANTDNISTLAGRLALVEDQFGLSKWRTADGKFNTARLASDLTAGVVLGTTGALVTSSVVKKKQVKDGFESLECTVGGQHVGDWGDVFRIDGK